MVAVVGFGEAMVLFEAPDLARAGTARIDVAGAELNLCAAAARLGLPTAFCTKVGADPLGERVSAALGDLGVGNLIDVSHTHPTGVFLKDVRPDGQRRVHYYRRGSAASTMDTSDAARVLALRPEVVAVSGITAALGPGPRAAVLALARAATIAFDPNFRPALGSIEDQVAFARTLLESVDFLLLGLEEAELLFGTGDPEAVFRASPARETILKAGPDGCYFPGGHQPSLVREIVDPVGAGDAFAGGYLAARLRGAPVARAALLGSQLAASVVGSYGDSTGLPEPVEAEGLLRRALKVG